MQRQRGPEDRPSAPRPSSSIWRTKGLIRPSQPCHGDGSHAPRYGGMRPVALLGGSAMGPSLVGLPLDEARSIDQLVALAPAREWAFRAICEAGVGAYD